MFAKLRRPIDWKEVSSKLKDKGALQPCPRCGKTKFTFAGEANIPIVTYESPISAIPRALPRSIADIDAPSSIPAIIISCDNCGYLMQHALGILLEDTK